MIRRCAWLALLVGCTAAPPRVPKSDGERAYLAKCSGCHAVYEPSEYPPEKWEKSVAKMERQKRVRLTDEERALIVGYLTGRTP